MQLIANACLSFADVKGKWEKSSWGRKLIVQKRRAALNDFDRFKVMLAKIKVRNPVFKWLISVVSSTLLTHCFFVRANRGVVLSGKNSPSSRRLLQHRMACWTALEFLVPKLDGRSVSVFLKPELVLLFYVNPFRTL
jgi:hypothetical protein